MDIARLVRHLLASPRRAHALFSPATMARLQRAIADGEATHRAEVRLIVESALPLRKIRRGLDPRQRAIDLFGTFRVWDTEHNNGVLLYVNLADRRLEVVVDRAAARAVDAGRWQAVCDTAQSAFRQGRFEQGVADALEAIRSALAVAFPPQGGATRRNELPDVPVVL